eukprot:13718022-Alexandrium_andersonii.AAC.1
MSCWMAPEWATAAPQSSSKWPWCAWPAASRRWSTDAAASACDVVVASTWVTLPVGAPSSPFIWASLARSS